ncbi:putative peptide ABC transporter ATP-binding protein y4tR [Chlamydiales bacterium STE3]|nr:putative peptide ABC transporter ATP-binding protein y4tR [Chlamydiales bacterium STE3]
MTDPVLNVQGLTAKLKLGNSSYKVVDKVSFLLFPGKTLALVGESGCGKSLTALSILRILPSPPALSPEGSIFFHGENLLTLSEKKMSALRGKSLAMIFQDPSSALNPVYSIGSQLVEVAELHLNLYGDEAFRKVIEILHKVGIPSPEKRFYSYPHQLSGGMRQRILIAMALMCEPEVLIADEPTTALDVTIQAQVLDLIRDLQKQNKMALLLITHDMGVVAEMADEVVVMYATQIVEKGAVQQIFDQPSHPYTVALFKSRPSTETNKGELPTIKGSVPNLRHIPKGCPFHPRCPFAMEKCRTGHVPEFIINSNPLHTARCWLHEKQEILL